MRLFRHRTAQWLNAGLRWLSWHWFALLLGLILSFIVGLAEAPIAWTIEPPPVKKVTNANPINAANARAAVAPFTPVRAARSSSYRLVTFPSSDALLLLSPWGKHIPTRTFPTGVALDEVSLINPAIFSLSSGKIITPVTNSLTAHARAESTADIVIPMLTTHLEQSPIKGSIDPQQIEMGKSELFVGGNNPVTARICGEEPLFVAMFLNDLECAIKRVNDRHTIVSFPIASAQTVVSVSPDARWIMAVTPGVDKVDLALIETVSGMQIASHTYAAPSPTGKTLVDAEVGSKIGHPSQHRWVDKNTFLAFLPVPASKESRSQTDWLGQLVRVSDNGLSPINTKLEISVKPYPNAQINFRQVTFAGPNRFWRVTECHQGLNRWESMLERARSYLLFLSEETATSFLGPVNAPSIHTQIELLNQDGARINERFFKGDRQSVHISKTGTLVLRDADQKVTAYQFDATLTQVQKQVIIFASVLAISSMIRWLVTSILRRKAQAKAQALRHA